MAFANSPHSCGNPMSICTLEHWVVRITIPWGKGVDEIAFLYFRKEAKLFPHQVAKKRIYLQTILTIKMIYEINC